MTGKEGLGSGDNEAEKRLRAEEQAKELLRRLEEWRRDASATSFVEKSAVSRLEKGIGLVIREADEIVSESPSLLSQELIDAIKKAASDLLEKLEERRRFSQKHGW